MASRFFRVYLLPGFVFQGIVVAGGYGTGREQLEFFLNYGTLGGILGMWLVTALVWGVVLAASFEFARMFKVYNYRSFFRELLGSLWVAYEGLYVLFLLLVLAVVGAAAGSTLQSIFNIPTSVGMLLLLAVVGLLTAKGSGIIARFLSWWTFAVYGVYILLIVLAFSAFGRQISQLLALGEVKPGWVLGGFRYGLYNLGVFPGVFFVLPEIRTRFEAVASGFIATVIAIIPGFLFYMAILGGYPQVMATDVPVLFLLQRLGAPSFFILFQVVFFGTLIETGTGFIHAVNERINSVYSDGGRQMPGVLRLAVSIVLLSIAGVLSKYGLVDLIAKGYGTISWGFFVLHVVPLITIGLVKVSRVGKL